MYYYCIYAVYTCTYSMHLYSVCTCMCVAWSLMVWTGFWTRKAFDCLHVRMAIFTLLATSISHLVELSSFIAGAGTLRIARLVRIYI